MRKLLPIVMILMATPAYAGGLVTKHASSVQLTVDAARSTAVRIGGSYSAAGSNITAGTMGGATSGAGTYTVATSGQDWSLTESYNAADTVPASAATVGAIPNFGNVTSYAAGSAGTLAGTIDRTHAITLTAGGAGSSATGQFVSEITVID
ncbi:hypothetical protein RW03080701_164 [Synechococcus phage S-RIM8]|uniref:OMP1 protein n=1 Tax=Synechococcus phage S-RIM8 TaxID=756278 RepID=A0A1D7SAA1_9CAUD|nr:hypothetical protein RW03080701_164 [Synechococcus phage S-RIM8]